MAIIAWPDDRPMPANVTCALCGSAQPLSAMTAGRRDAYGEQAFACERHFRNKSQYIVGWADFAITQKRIYESVRLHMLTQQGNPHESHLR